jgi:hypothetical protein
MTDERPPSFHVTTLLVASDRALNNALDELGFSEEDDRVIEHEGKLAFLTCSHERDNDDFFALVTELCARGESWELQFRVDVGDNRALFQTLARHRPIEAQGVALEEESAEAAADVTMHDVDSDTGRQALAKSLKRVDPGAVFATLRPGPGEGASALVIERGSRRVLAGATAGDETTLRGAIREILPRIMFDVGVRSPT